MREFPCLAHFMDTTLNKIAFCGIIVKKKLDSAETIFHSIVCYRKLGTHMPVRMVNQYDCDWQRGKVHFLLYYNKEESG